MSRTVGILALQGDFAEHEAALQRAGLQTRLVRDAAALAGLGGLVLPGGESSTMLRLLGVEGLFEPLGRVLGSGIPVFATCAGMILLAEHVEPAQRSYGLLPIRVVRNGYGRQLHSGTFALRCESAGGSAGGPAGAASESLPPAMTGTFIRAPRITAVTADCEVLAMRGEDPVLVRRGPILAAAFHPELTPDHPVTGLFVRMVNGRGAAPVGSENATEAAG